MVNTGHWGKSGNTAGIWGSAGHTQGMTMPTIVNWEIAWEVDGS
jgi:hypothetical protein